MADVNNGQQNSKPSLTHPVRDIVLPLATVMVLVGNTLMIGIAWGRITQKQETYEFYQSETRQQMREALQLMEKIEDRVHDLERDAVQDRKDFSLLENYTRGRIDHLPYRTPRTRQRD